MVLRAPDLGDAGVGCALRGVSDGDGVGVEGEGDCVGNFVGACTVDGDAWLDLQAVDAVPVYMYAVCVYDDVAVRELVVVHDSCPPCLMLRVVCAL